MSDTDSTAAAAKGGYKTLRVGAFEYAINEFAGNDIGKIVEEIKQALVDHTVVEVPVLDVNGNRRKLLLNGAATDAVVLDLAEGPPRPGEMS